MNKLRFALPEEMKYREYVVATYYIRIHARDDVIKKALAMAVGQTAGTWIDVPGITKDMEENHIGKVLGISSIPPFELTGQNEGENQDYLVQLAYPTINFDRSFPLMLTALLGNDASTSAQVKLVELSMPERFAESFKGPKFGIEGLRSLFPGRSGPLTMNMIKPCTGISPKQGAEIFYRTALGGIDIIKDDELLGNTSFSAAAERVREYNRASDAAYERTGKHTLYVCNITDDVSRIEDTLKAVLEAGVKAVMMNYSVLGYSTFSWLAEKSTVPVMGHYAVSGAFCEGINSGMSSHLAAGKLPRLAGADFTMINTPYGGYPLTYEQYIKTSLSLTLPLYNIKPCMPVVGGGVHPGMVPLLVKDLGEDIIIAAGGAVQGHPMGAAAGAKALVDAADAVSRNVDLKEAAENSTELAKALELWGMRE